VFIVTAVTDRSLGSKGISAFVVPRDIEGFTLEPGETKLGMRGSDWASLVFQDARIPRSHLLGPAGEGFSTFMKTLEGGRISIGALSLGLAEGAFECATKYAMEREAFGGSLADQQAVQFKLADMQAQLHVGRSIVRQAARAMDNANPDKTALCAMAKRVATDAGFDVCNEALQLFGGYGYLADYGVERNLRDVRVMQILEGTNEIMRVILARDILGANR